jgi:hypothetical protein
MHKQIVHIQHMKSKLSKAVREYMASLGQKGGKASGERKARTPEQARKAALARWDRVNAEKTKQ